MVVNFLGFDLNQIHEAKTNQKKIKNKKIYKSNDLNFQREGKRGIKVNELAS